MQRRGFSGRYFRRGIVNLLAVQFLVIFAALGVVLAALTDLEVQKADGYRAATEARLAAESGLQFIVYQLRNTELPPDTTSPVILLRLAESLSERLDDRYVIYTGNAVIIPEVQYDDSRRFSCWITLVDPEYCRVTVRGTAAGVDRHLSIDMAVTPGLPSSLEYGIAARGPIGIGGGAKLLGANDRSEADVMSATESTRDAIVIKGNVVVSGDVFVSGDGARVVTAGGPSIGGSTDSDVIDRHIHLAAEEPSFPEFDMAPLAVHATNIMDGSTDMGAPSFTNIRIRAGTNPTFNAGVVLNGVVLIEAPNKVKFNGGATINGIIITEPAPASLKDCQIYFGGGLDVGGVEALPDTPEYAELKQQTGTFLLAPGFAVEFAGNVEVINGMVAADQLDFSGTSGGVIYGPIIGLKDLPVKVDGNIELLIDRSATSRAGIKKVFGFEPVSGTYSELIGQQTPPIPGGFPDPGLQPNPEGPIDPHK